MKHTNHILSILGMPDPTSKASRPLRMNAAGTALEYEALYTVNVLDYGADSTGVSNSKTAFTNAIATGLPVYVPKGTYLVNGTGTGVAQLTLNAGQTIFGDGEASIIKTTTSDRILALGDNSIASKLRFEGSGAGAGLQWQAGVIASTVKWLITDCTFVNFSGNDTTNGGGGVFFASIAPGSTVGGRIEGCSFLNNYAGLNFASRGEYITVTGCIINGNTTGIADAAGNITISNCVITTNTTGIKLQDGTNDGHGFVSNCTINHNTTNLDIADQAIGMTFSNCGLYVGDINISNSSGIKFIACDIADGGTVTLTNNTNLYRTNCYINNTVTVVSGENFTVIQDVSLSANSKFLQLASDDYKITDLRGTTTGLEYSADYSAGFSTRSLVDKGYVTTNFQPLDADLTTIAGLADPNADRVLFWDDSAGAYAYLTMGTNLSITGTTLNASGGSGGTGKSYATLSIGASDALDTDPTHYDYVCDGTADQVQILAAIAALPSTGGKIVLSDGTFNLAAAIVIDNDNVVLEGQGQATKLFLVNATNANVITVGNGATAYVNIQVRDLSIDGNKANQTTNGHGIFISSGAAHTTIENCRIVATYKSNIYDEGSAHAKIRHNYLDTPGTASWNIFNNGSGFIIHGNECIAGTSGNIETQSTSHTSNNIISNNICTGSTANGIKGNSWQVVISGNFVSNFSVSGIISGVPCNVTGNTVEINNNPSGSGIELTSSDPQQCTANTIFIYSGNTSAVTSIKITAPSTTVTGNNLQSESTGSPAHTAIDIQADHCTVSGNAITQYQFTGSGIKLNTTDVTVSGNMVYGYAKGINGDNSFRAVIANNHIDCTTGVSLIDAVWCTVTGNHLKGGTGIGINVGGTTFFCRCTITGNSIEEFGQEGIVLRKVTKSTISNNTIRDCGQTTNNTYAGIILRNGDSSYNTLQGNVIESGEANKHSYGIRENASGDGPNIIVGNIALNAVTAQISTQNTSSDVSHNITV